MHCFQLCITEGYVLW